VAGLAELADARHTGAAEASGPIDPDPGGGPGGAGRRVFQWTLWLIVLCDRRGEVSRLDAWEANGPRFDLEPYFRLGKQRLWRARFPTLAVEHEENWLTLVQLASVPLWLGRELAGVRRRS